MSFQTRATIAIILLASFEVSLISNQREKKQIKNDEEFVATNEWKEIKPGQKVPSGLHYRINLSTGKKEAKTISETDKLQHEQDSKGFTLVEESDDLGDRINTDDLEQLLKNVDKKNPEKDMPKQFRSLDEIKQELGEIDLSPKSDIELLQELFHKYKEQEKKKTRDENLVLDILHNMKYLSHQIDNGNEFYKMGGFTKIIYKELNSTNTQIKQESLKLFSALAQNNPKVKVHILETGGIITLLRILNLEKAEGVKKSALTALSCTLRTFPYAQNKFIEIGGLKMFTELFLSEDSVKLKLKIVTLLNDLIVERQEDSANFEHHEFVDIESTLYDLNWCSFLNELLHDLVVVDINDFDSIEKCLLAMASLSSKCQHSYNRELISKLHQEYLLLREVNTEENHTQNYFHYLENLTLNLLETMRNTIKKEEPRKEL
ncbi:nucleotide exchange factor SIL1 [Euwallacea similis]|uniref:nucleotide exchange factor SIL1 n=1 Tax=Euwallacea similis TaxID=1736056 RepID=UPI00344EC5F9